MIDNTVGFFGKLPVLGDFVSRRLPRDFIDPWDKWLQASIRLSQEVLGDDWLSLFLVSPIWRFALSPGICGASAWVGIIIPSVDRVGRYYPLTLAVSIDVESMTTVFLSDSSWFSEVEDIALTVFTEQFNLDEFERSLLNINTPSQSCLRNSHMINSADIHSSTKAAFRFDLSCVSQTDRVFPMLSQGLLARSMGEYSFWATEGFRDGRSLFLCCASLPPIDTYADFLKGMPESSKDWQCGVYVQAPCETKSIPQIAEDDERTVPNSKALHVPTWQSNGITEVGNRRTHNEDAMLNAPELGLWVVADGMGGHLAGDVASKLVIDSLAAMPLTDTFDLSVNWICSCLQRVNGELCELAAQFQRGGVIGSTVVALVARGYDCAVIWAGDSRLYQMRDGQFKQITRDHTLVDELIVSGGVAREVAVQQVGANVITRAVGGGEALELDVLRFQAKTGDRYLLCSDGLDKELDESEMAHCLCNFDGQVAVDGLVSLALSRNGIDNITVLVAQFD